MVWRNLWYRKGRSLLTSAGIAIGVAAIIALGAMAEGVAEGYASIAGGSGADLLVTQADVTDLTFSTLDEPVGERIAALSDVKSVSGVIFNMVQLEDIPYFVVGGYDPDEVAIQHYKIVEGQQHLSEKHILLGRQAADNLDMTVGDTIRLYDTPFRVSGIYETGQSFEEGGGVITLVDAQAIFKKPRQVTFFQVQARDPELIDAVQARIEKLFDDVSVSKADDFADRANDGTVTASDGLGHQSDRCVDRRPRGDQHHGYGSVRADARDRGIARSGLAPQTHSLADSESGVGVWGCWVAWPEVGLGSSWSGSSTVPRRYLASRRGSFASSYSCRVLSWHSYWACLAGCTPHGAPPG